jgi:D-alanine-D-alanine ligase
VKPVEIHADGAWELARGFVGEELSTSSEEWFVGEKQEALDALTRLRHDGIDVVFNALHGPGGEDGTIQGMLRFAGLAFTGPDVAVAAVTMDKRLTKLALDAVGILVPAGVDLPRRSGKGLEWPLWTEETRAVLPFPWIVKPNCLGSSVGIEVFETADEFVARAVAVGDDLWRPRPEIAGSGFLIESVVAGRELTCGVLETDGPPRALPPIEIRPRTSEFFDYEAKYTPGATEEICPAPLDEAQNRAVQEIAVRVHTLFECAPLSRVDLFLTDTGELIVLEINTLPGMTDTSLIPQSAKAAGISLECLFGDLVAHALRREETRDSVGVL